MDFANRISNKEFISLLSDTLESPKEVPTSSQEDPFNVLSYVSMGKYFPESSQSIDSSSNVRSNSLGQNNKTSSVFPKDFSIEYQSAVPRINIADVQIFGMLGRGGLGDVCYGKYKGNDVAIKILRGYGKDILSAMQKHLQHPLESVYLVKILGYFDDEQNIRCGIVMEKMHGSLRQLLVQQKKISIEQALDIGLQICGGIQHLHFHHITHGDLKPDNILLKKNENGSFMVKICDFDGIKIRDSVTKVSHAGPHATAFYSPPEYFTRKGYSNKFDIYSFGIILNEMITGEFPFSGYDSMQASFAIVYEGKRPNISDEITDELKSLIQRCWDAETNNRPNYFELTKELRQIRETVRKLDTRMHGIVTQITTPKYMHTRKCLQEQI